jgi:hypothetical protein
MLINTVSIGHQVHPIPLKNPTLLFEYLQLVVILRNMVRVDHQKTLNPSCIRISNEIYLLNHQLHGQNI